MKEKLYIAGTATLDGPGILATRAGALRFANKLMRSDLRRVGFQAGVVQGKEIYNGKYRPVWRINYGK